MHWKDPCANRGVDAEMQRPDQEWLAQRGDESGGRRADRVFIPRSSDDYGKLVTA
jgi:hypothetical protein